MKKLQVNTPREDHKQETKVESKPEPKLEPKPEPKPKVEPKPEPKLESKPDAVYLIEVQTGKETNAGVDAPVDIVITGSNGELPKFALKDAKSNNKDLFEKGNLDIFELKEKDIGKVNFCL